jgi:hypothetical protein
LRSASKKAPLGKEQDFVGLHNVYKQIIYLQESVNAALQTMKHLSNYHQSRGAPGYHPMADATFRMLALVQTKFESTQLRLSSLEKRMQNVISLVGFPCNETLGDRRLMDADRVIVIPSSHRAGK